MTDDFSDIKVGDEVGFIEPGFWPRPVIRKVKRVTAHYFDVGANRYRKSNGKEMTSFGSPGCVKKATDEFRAEVKTYQDNLDRRKVARELTHQLHKLPLSALEQIQAIVSEHLEAGK